VLADFLAYLPIGPKSGTLEHKRCLESQNGETKLA
jgi:hypothetical protein